MNSFEETLHDVVSDVIRTNKDETNQAEKMLKSINKVAWAAYIIRVGGKEFYIVAKEGAYYYDLQYCIERVEKRNFQELGWDDLSEKNIIHLNADETMGVVIESDGVYTSLYDHVVTCTRPCVVHSSQCTTTSPL